MLGVSLTYLATLPPFSRHISQ